MGSDCIRAVRLGEESGLYSKSQWEPSEDFEPKKTEVFPQRGCTKGQDTQHH